ncbi:MAG: CRTAC1 family protein, partial [Elusimicrobiota bacterium]
DNDIGKDVLYRNLGNGKFQEVTEKAGVADYGAGMGISVGDFNRDGWPDLYGTNIGMYSVRARYVRPTAKTRMQTNLQLDQYFRIKQANRLYRNNKNGTFTNVVDELMGPIYTGWGWNGMFFDFDNDGFLDVHVSNGALPYNLFYHDERNVLIHQDPKTGRFHDVSRVSGVDFPGNSRGVTFADYDQDGFLDFVVIGIHPPVFFRNSMDKTGHHWLSVRLRGTVSNRDSIGARIEVKAGGAVQTDWVGGQGGGLSSQCSKDIHFGLGKSDTVDWVKVRWPSGRRKTLRGLKADRRIVIVEPGPGRPARPGIPSRIPSLAR